MSSKKRYKDVRMNVVADFVHQISLLRLSLEEKWNSFSNKCLSDYCPFCHDAGSVLFACEICTCPKKICNSQGLGGYVAKLIKSYGKTTKVYQIEKEDLRHMRLLITSEINRLHGILRTELLK